MDGCSVDSSGIAKDILLYLSAHPDAEDTVEGIAGHWLAAHRTRPSLTVLKDVLSDLVTQGLIEVFSGEKGPVLYRTRKREGKI
jgi:DNA-binding IscR family transcriptional regulator